MRKPYAIYYAKDPTFNSNPELTKLNLAETHTLLTIGMWDEQCTLDNLYLDMQGERWSPNGEARPLIERAKLHHTSMSVGDVIVSLEDDRAWEVDRIGFKEIE
jgi:hypothetical protein